LGTFVAFFTHSWTHLSPFSHIFGHIIGHVLSHFVAFCRIFAKGVVVDWGCDSWAHLLLLGVKINLQLWHINAPPNQQPPLLQMGT